MELYFTLAIAAAAAAGFVIGRWVTSSPSEDECLSRVINARYELELAKRSSYDVSRRIEAFTRELLSEDKPC